MIKRPSIIRRKDYALRLTALSSNVNADGTEAILRSTLESGEQRQARFTIEDIGQTIGELEMVDRIMRAKLSRNTNGGETAIQMIAQAARSIYEQTVYVDGANGDILLLAVLRDRMPISIRLNRTQAEELLEKLYHCLSTAVAIGFFIVMQCIDLISLVTKCIDIL